MPVFYLWKLTKTIDVWLIVAKNWLKEAIIAQFIQDSFFSIFPFAVNLLPICIMACLSNNLYNKNASILPSVH